jgi:hypothetical protein
MDDQLQRLIELQTEQNQLLKRYLWRFRFSLLTLLVLTTMICCSLGVMLYKQQSARPVIVSPAPTGVWTSSGTLSIAPAPTLNTWSGLTSLPDGSLEVNGPAPQQANK